MLLSGDTWMNIPGVLPQFTGGQTIHYPGYSYEKDAEKFAGDLMHVLTRETGWEAVMRVRATLGVKVIAIVLLVFPFLS